MKGASESVVGGRKKESVETRLSRLKAREVQVMYLYRNWLKSSLSGGAKTSGFNDLKERCIELIQSSLRSLNRESFRASQKGYFLTNCGITLTHVLIA